MSIAIKQKHQPVLLNEVLECSDIKGGEKIFEGTVGMGGHTEAILKRLSNKAVYIGMDLDSEILEETKRNLSKYKTDQYYFEGNFVNVKKILNQLNIEKIDLVLLDVGFGTHHLNSGRGFSFMLDEPLNMSLNPNNNDLTAFEIVNNADKETLLKILREFGEEKRWANRIASRIIERREKQEIKTTQELVGVIKEAVPFRFQFGKRNIATKTFQAIRIAVNDELGSLVDFLEVLPSIMHEDSKFLVISFHSLEDRIVKNTFKTWAKLGMGVASKKPITPSGEEVDANSRSRSAKLRVFTFIK